MVIWEYGVSNNINGRPPAGNGGGQSTGAVSGDGLAAATTSASSAALKELEALLKRLPDANLPLDAPDSAPKECRGMTAFALACYLGKLEVVTAILNLPDYVKDVGTAGNKRVTGLKRSGTLWAAAAGQTAASQGGVARDPRLSIMQ